MSPRMTSRDYIEDHETTVYGFGGTEINNNNKNTMIFNILLEKRDTTPGWLKRFLPYRKRFVLIMFTCSSILACVNALIVLGFLEQPVIEAYMRQQYDDELDQRIYYKYPSKQHFSIDRPFIISNHHLCERNKPYLIIVIPSRNGNFEERQAVRFTYGSLSSDKVSRISGINIEHIVSVVYILGAPENVTEQEQIYSEHAQYGDTVQIDIEDTYYNLTYKMLYAFRWLNMYCRDVTYVLKSDDDTFVHIGILFQQIESRKQHRNGNIYGRIYNTTTHLKVNKDDSKWGIRNSEYPLRKYPTYAQGSSYTMTFDLVPKILQRAIYLPYLHIEDVFLTGILGGKILGAELVELNKTSDWTLEIPDPCTFAITGQLAMSNMAPDIMYKTWSAISTNAYMCDKTLPLSNV